MNACFVLEQTTQEHETNVEAEKYTQLENKLHDSIKAYITTIKKSEEVYKSYDFSDVYEIKPEEIKAYEALVKHRNRLPYLESVYHEKLEQEISKTDSLIQDKKTFIKENKIHTTYEIGHIYALSFDSNHTITELIFYHYPNGKVKDLSVNYQLNLSEKQKASFESYFYQKPIYYNNSEADYNFYDRVNSQLEKETDKSTFLKHCLVLVESIKTNGSLIPEKVMLKITQEKYPEKTIEKFIITKSNHEGLASDVPNNSVYQANIISNNESILLYFDDWFRLITP